MKDLLIKGKLADVIPWHGQVGGGQQMRFKFGPLGSGSGSLQELIDQGFIKITIKDSPNGTFSKYIGNVILK